MMLSFEINGIGIDLGNTSVNHRMNNPMFGEVGSYSLPFTIPNSIHNRQAFECFEPAALKAGNILPARINIGPQRILGSFVINTIADDIIEGYFLEGNSVFRKAVSGVNLSDIDYTETIPGSSTVSFTDALDSAAASSYPTYNYTCFPMLCPKYFGGDPFSYNFLINLWRAFSSTPGDYGFEPSSSRNIELLYAPSFYLNFVLKKIFETYGYVIVENLLYDDTEYRTLVIPNFNTLGEADTTYCERELKFADALPSVEINAFIDGLENLFNITFFIDSNSKEVRIKSNTSIVKSSASRVLDIQSRVLDVDPEIDGFELSYEMDSDDSHSSINSIENYELGLTIQGKKDILYFSTYPASNYKGLLAKITANDLYYISKLSDASTDSWEWELLTKDYFSYNSGNKELSISSIINPVLTDDDWIYIYGPAAGTKDFALFPRVDKSCINSEGVQEYNTFSSVRLLFYRGIQESGGGELNTDDIDISYPLATPDVYKAKGFFNGSGDYRYGREKMSTANKSLRWDGEYGLYENNYKDYLYWFINLRKSATDRYNLSFEEILSIKFWEKYKTGGMSVLIKSMDITLDFANDQVILEDCEVYIS